MSLMVRLMDLERRLKALEARRDLDEGTYARIEGDTPLDAVGVLTPAVPKKRGRPRKEVA